MAERQIFVFPYELIKKGERIVLYGAGAVGRSFYAQIENNDYVHIVKWVDKGNDEGVDIDYLALQFDHVLIAIESEIIAEEIKEFLIGKGVEPGKIIWKYPTVKYSLPEKNPPAIKKPDYRGYSVEKNTQYLIALLKAAGIKKVIISPGTTNICFVKSLMNDGTFELFSAADERSAAYMACGMASHSKEPVVLSCTGATASRNYIPGLTEAFYRKLPVLAVTSSQYFGRVDNNIAQMMDRRYIPKDIAVYQARIPMVRTPEDEWSCRLEINKSIIALKRFGGGPVHIDLETDYSQDYSVEKLPETSLIDYYEDEKDFPEISAKKVAVCIGAHTPFTEEQTELIEKFCEKYNGVVLCDFTGNYRGKYQINPALITSQRNLSHVVWEIEIMIYFGETTGYSYLCLNPKEIWRVDADGKVKDLFRKTSGVFAVSPSVFFRHYNDIETKTKQDHEYYDEWCSVDASFRKGIDLDLIPFSNPWIGLTSLPMVDTNAVLHLAILNTLRSWNLISSKNVCNSFSNTGGFGIDGCMSSLIGSSLYDKDKIYYGIIGDLAFFYDMNSLGNRHIGSNVRILLINNGMGAEFRNYGNPGKEFGDETNDYIAAAGHYGNKSRELVKHYATNLGFEYLLAENKEEFLAHCDRFFTREHLTKPILFEVFTDYRDEAKAIEILYNL